MLTRLFRSTRPRLTSLSKDIRQNAHSPLHKYIGENAKNLRSELFTTKYFVPARKFTFCVAIWSFTMMMGVSKLREIMSIQRCRAAENLALQRPCLPIYQSLEDLFYLVLDDRFNFVMDAVFAEKSEQWIKAAKSRYNSDPDHWYALSHLGPPSRTDVLSREEELTGTTTPTRWPGE